MTFTTKKLKDCQVELAVDLNKDELLLYADEAEKKIAKEIKIEGFRSGKAPKEMVRRKIGEQAIKEEALNLAVSSSLAQALSEQKLDILEQSDFQIKENSASRLVFTVKLLVFPEIKLGEYRGLSVKRSPVAVTEAEVKEVLNDVIKSRTILKEVKRPARLGDRVEIDFEVKDQGVVIEGGKSENYPVILGENKFMPGFEAQIVSLKPGEKKSFSLKAPSDYYQISIAGKELYFEVVLKKVEEVSVPELNDEFVKSLGQFASEADLETSIKKGLNTEKEAREKERLRLAVLKEIAGRTKVDVPELLAERRLDAMIQGFDNELHQKGMELGLYLAHIKKTQDDLKRDWRKQAEEQVRLDLIVRAITKEEKLKVSEEELNRELQAVLQQYMINGLPDGKVTPGQEALQNIDPEQLKNRIRSALLNEKVFEFLEKHNKFV